MKNRILLLLLSFTFTHINAQSVEGFSTLKSSNLVSVSENTLGHNYIEGRDIVGQHFKLKKSIYNFYLDTINTRFTFHLRSLSLNKKYYTDKGQVLQYDAKLDMCMWRLRFNYDVAEVLQTDRAIVYTHKALQYFKARSSGLYAFNGAKSWEERNYIIHLNNKYNIGIAYRSSGALMEGIDLETGDVLWSKKMKYGINRHHTLLLNDSTFAISGDELSAFNIKDGSGWAFSPPGGSITQTVSSDYSPDRIFRLSQDSLCLYHSNSTHISCLDKRDGGVLWQVQFNVPKLSYVSIFQNDSVIYYLSSGYAPSKDLSKRKGGAPSVSAYDKLTGKELYSVEIGIKKDYIVDYTFSSDSLYVLLDNKIALFSLASGNLLTTAVYSLQYVQQYGKLKGFVSRNNFVRDKNGFQSMYDKYDQHIFMKTAFGYTLEFGETLKPFRPLASPQMYHIAFVSDSLAFYTGNDSVFVLDSDENIVSQFAGGSLIKRYGDKIYTANDEDFYEIDISQIH